jgi:Tol biopolymer transport system component
VARGARGPRGAAPVETGFATACNNDHGFSPDGTRIAISHETESGSAIYLMPAGGGWPERVTPEAPSYWHGWSPDGTKLAYCALRGGRYDIHTIPVAGSAEETRLTAEGHNDGPDYAPDGSIWFNSDRSGHAQIWWMGPDGADQRQVTADGFVNWFPHPSPDGSRVVYLAYPPGTTGHPGGLDVALRIMAPDGSGVRTLVELHGGQGTINVPSWSPDGAAFAYMRYDKA